MFLMFAFWHDGHVLEWESGGYMRHTMDRFMPRHSGTFLFWRFQYPPPFIVSLSSPRGIDSTLGRPQYRCSQARGVAGAARSLAWHSDSRCAAHHRFWAHRVVVGRGDLRPAWFLPYFPDCKMSQRTGSASQSHQKRMRNPHTVASNAAWDGRTPHRSRRKKVRIATHPFRYCPLLALRQAWL